MSQFFQETFTFFTPAFFNEHSFIIFVIGLFWGSFLNVCIYRIPLGQSIVIPGSHCFSCGQPIAWYDNIPLVSYIILLGKCRRCNSAFSPRYFFIELLTGILFLLVFRHFKYSWATVFYIGFVSSLIIATFTDIDHWIIPDRISLGGLIVSLAFSFVGKSIGPSLVIVRADPFYGDAFYNPFLNALVGAIAGFILLWAIGLLGSFIFKKEAMGWGDIKLFAYIGSVLGVFNTILVLALSSILGATIGVSLILSSKMVQKLNLEKKELPDTINPSESYKFSESSMNSENQENKPQGSPEQPEISPPLSDENNISKISQIPQEEIFTSSTDILKYSSENMKIKTLIETLNQSIKKRKYHQLPYGPYICVATIFILFFEDKINHFFNTLFLP